VRDEWLGLIGLSDFDLSKGFPQAKRDRLGRILDEMYPLLVRLDARSARGTRPRDAPTGAGVPLDADLQLRIVEASQAAAENIGVSVLDRYLEAA